MEALAAVALVGNVVQFAEFLTKLVVAARQAYVSKSGLPDEIDDVCRRLKDVDGLAIRLEAREQGPLLPEDEAALAELVKNCKTLAGELLKATDGLRAKTSNSKKAALLPSWKAWLKKGELEDMEKRIDLCRRQILERVVMMMSETQMSTWRIIDSAVSSQKMRDSKALVELRQVRADVIEAAEAANMSHRQAVGSLDEIRLLIERLWQVTTASTSRVLNRLRFDEIHERELGIEDANCHTFRWLLYDHGESGEESCQKSKQDSSRDAYSIRTHDLEIDVTNEASPASVSSSVTSQGLPLREPTDRRRARELFLSWLRSGRHVFYISGSLGSGKSTLMKLLCNDPKTADELELWAGDKKLIFAQTYFWSSGTKIQKSLEGLYRSILWETLRSCPELIHVIFSGASSNSARNAEAAASCHRLEDDPFPLNEVEAAFKRLIKSRAILDSYKICLFIDGLDEYDGDHWRLAQDLNVWSRLGNVKICVASRLNNEFEKCFGKQYRLRLHELTRLDMEQFVHDVFRRDGRIVAAGDIEGHQRLADSLVDRAEGVFLWLSLAVKDLLAASGTTTRSPS